MNPLETYLRELAEIRGPGVPETSFYPPLRNLLNAIGDTLKPKVRCIINLKNKGAGIPDGGLFTADLLKKNAKAEPLDGLPPDRGAIEVKSTGDDAWLVADSPQVSKYWAKYGHVLVTNYRDFVMVGRDSQGKPVKLETYRLAESEAAFWTSAAQPRKAADLHGERFIEYLKRVMLHAAPIAAPEDVAWFLASYARDARIRIEQQPDLPALAAVRTALEEALGLKFQDVKGEHFFRSTLVQTLFYGIFSAWVLWHREDPLRKDRFDWATASRYDIYLNDVACWKNVPANVWDYTIGGYQVIKKWLSYREKALLGRRLTLDEVHEVTNMARRIAAILLLQPALDANYNAVKSSAHQWER
jgi:hypothetical protein